MMSPIKPHSPKNGDVIYGRPLPKFCSLVIKLCTVFYFFFLQVLMTYWDMDEYQVEDVMTEFLKKSLAQSEFDSTLGTSIISSLYPILILSLSKFYLEKL